MTVPAELAITKANELSCLEVFFLKSLDYIKDNGLLVGVVFGLHSEAIWAWSMKEDGVVSKEYEIIPVPKFHTPHSSALVQIGGKSRVIVRIMTGEDKIDELWEVNFKTAPKGLAKQIDTSKIPIDWSNQSDATIMRGQRGLVTGWENLLFIPTYASEIVVFKDLQSHSVISTQLECVDRISVSTKYLVTSSKSDDMWTVRAFLWSPDRIKIGDMVFGPINVNQLRHQPFLFNSQYIFVGIDPEESDKNNHIVAVHNIEDKKSTQFLVSSDGTESDVIMMFKVGSKIRMYLGDGECYELQ